MTVNIQTSIIIPAYNEEKGLLVVLAQLGGVLNDSQICCSGGCSSGVEIIVVNDGSSDKTAEVAAKYGCKIISHQNNMGKGKAIQTGIANSRGQNIIFIDADGTYPTEEIPHMIDKLRDYDAVFTVRESKNIPLLNLIGNKIIAATIKAFSGFPGHDPISGFYGLRRSAMEKIDVAAMDFSIETEIVVKATVMGLRITELPVKYGRRLGESKLSPFSDGLRIFKFILSLTTRYNPLITFILPGIFLCLLGVVLFLLTASGDFRVTKDIVLGIHTFIFSVMIFLVGFQVVFQGVILDLYAVKHKYKKPDMVYALFKSFFFKWVLIFGSIILVAGLLMTAKAVFTWISSGFQPYLATRQTIITLLLNLFGLQLIFSSLLGRVFSSEIKNSKS